jgi:hypothetical protein
MVKLSRKNAKHLQREMSIPKEEVKKFPLISLAQRIALKGIETMSTEMFSSIMIRMVM